MTTEAGKWNANFNIQLIYFLILVLLSEVLLVYTTYRLTKSNSEATCLKSCTENEIWDVINNKKFLDIIKNKVEESLQEVKNQQEFLFNTNQKHDSITERTRRDVIGITRLRRHIYQYDYRPVGGSRGPTGSRGPIGPPGLPGQPGQPGKPGSPGQPGSPGSPGQPAQPGQPGSPGQPGQPGQPGPKGPSGLPGLAGVNGFKGDKGSEGAPGLPGLVGLKGDEGSEGREGQPGLPGLPGQKGETGFPGDRCSQGNEGLLGRDGFKGEPGIPGLPGPMGAPGPRGPKGDCGICNPDTELKVEITKYGSDIYPDLFPKKINNIINKIDKIKKNVKYQNRIAMSELHPEKNTTSVWEARDTDSFSLLEYDHIDNFFNMDPHRVYDLFINFDESNKVIYDGNFYYKSATGRPAIVKYSLETNTVQVLGIPGVNVEYLTPLYKSMTTYFDFNVDENGLWLIFAVPFSSNTGIVKINTNNMTIENAWNITLNHAKCNEMFIASGILYTLKFSGNNLKIATALDLYKNEFFIMDLMFTEGPTSPDIKAWYEYKDKKLYITETGGEPLLYEYSILFEDSTNSTKFERTNFI